ncbi:ABC transporter permease [soil metagenome]
MRRALIKLVSFVAVIIVVSMLTFGLTQLLPGDPAALILGQSTSPERLAEVRADLKLDEPIWVQYIDWASSAVRGDFGESYRGGESVGAQIKDALPATVELLVAAQLLALLVAIPIGIFSAYRQNSLPDKITTGGSFALLSFPNFALAVVLSYVFAVNLGWFPTFGYVPITADLGLNIKSIALPTITLAVGIAAVYIRLLRSDMIATLQEDYILMARAKGMPTRYILFRHALRPSSFSLITVAGINVGTLIGGSVIVEFIFAIDGIGRLLVQAISTREYLLVQGVVLLIAITYVAINFLVDLLYTALDPRIRDA